MHFHKEMVHVFSFQTEAPEWKMLVFCKTADHRIDIFHLTYIC